MTTIPYLSEAERYVLGAMLWTRQATGEALDILHAEDFLEPRHRLIFRTLKNMYQEGGDIHPLLVAERMRRDGDKTERTKDYLVELLDDAGSALFLKSHAEIIVHRSNATKLSRAIADPHNMDDEQIQKATEDADGLLRRMSQQIQEPTKPLGSWVARDLEEIEEAGKTQTRMVGIETGFPTLDETTAGWEPGQLVVVGAQTGIGKTSLMLRFALEAASRGVRTLFFSLEMTPRELRQRIYAQEATVPLGQIRRGDVSDEGWTRLTSAGGRLREMPLLLCGKRGMTTGDITAEARRLAGEGPVGMIVVDYLQLVQSDRKMQRYEQVGEIARDLKTLAGEMGCVVITGSQLSRKVEERNDKRPMKSDLRESGDIEHTADVILLLHWPWKHDPRNQSLDPGAVELLVAKNRQGEADFGYEIRYVPEQTLHYEPGATA